MTYSAFVTTHNTLAPFAQNAGAKYVFEQILSRPDVVGWMIIASELKLPALAACAGEIERYCGSNPGCGLDLSQKPVRQAIGRMAAAVLKPAGYVPVKRRSIPQEMGLRYFHNAKFYEKREPPQVTVCVGLEAVEPQP